MKIQIKSLESVSFDHVAIDHNDWCLEFFHWTNQKNFILKTFYFQTF